ncbi:MAG: flagellar FlbD family protein [bacterium]|nr:flagellar FlbD family protein [bacterium]
MIFLHRLNGDEFAFNPFHIETIEETPDTVITLTNDRKYLVQESIKDIIDKIIDYQRNVLIKLGK